jgi:hypothetical protein
VQIHKVISTILHPIVVPTIGVMLYFLIIPNNLRSNHKLTILGLIFVVTYLIPLVILIIFKKINIIKSYKTESIKERKLPVAIMITLFYLLGNTLNKTSSLTDLSLLFYATSFGLFIIYLLFNFNIKASIHLLSLGISIGFFMVLSSVYNQNLAILIIVLILLSGVLASSRLHLEAHTNKEIYIGFFVGVLSNLGMYCIL